MESSVAAVPPSGKAPTGAAEVSPSLLPVITAQEPNDLTTPRSHAYLASSASTGFATVASTAPPQHPAIPSTEAGQSSRSLPHGYAHLTGPRFGALLRQLDSALGTFPHDEAFSSKGKARVIASTGGISIGDAGFGGSSARQREARYLTSTPGAMSRTALRALRGQPLARIHEDRRRRRKEALVRASTQGSPTTQAKLVPPHAGDDSYAPFSLPKLLERLGGLLRLHSLPPDRALLLARAGWERNDVSSLEARGAGELDRVVSKVCCSTCRAGLSYDAASSRGAESGQSVASGSMKESGDPAVALRMHHFEWCPWSIRWCQESLCRVPQTRLTRLAARSDLPRVADEISRAAPELQHTKVVGISEEALGRVKLSIAVRPSSPITRIEGRARLFPAEEIEITESTGERMELLDSALQLALYGWHVDGSTATSTNRAASSPSKSPTILTCAFCLRRLGLWNFTAINQQDSTPTLDARAQHRPFCPWVNGRVQNDEQDRDGGLDAGRGAAELRVEALLGGSAQGLWTAHGRCQLPVGQRRSGQPLSTEQNRGQIQEASSVGPSNRQGSSTSSALQRDGPHLTGSSREWKRIDILSSVRSMLWVPELPSLDFGSEQMRQS